MEKYDLAKLNGSKLLEFLTKTPRELKELIEEERLDFSEIDLSNLTFPICRFFLN